MRAPRTRVELESAAWRSTLESVLSSPVPRGAGPLHTMVVGSGALLDDTSPVHGGALPESLVSPVPRGAGPRSGSGGCTRHPPSGPSEPSQVKEYRAPLGEGWTAARGAAGQTRRHQSQGGAVPESLVSPVPRGAGSRSGSGGFARHPPVGPSEPTRFMEYRAPPGEGALWVFGLLSQPLQLPGGPGGE